ncbi:PH domain-containing protein [Williamsia deligens]|uniref:PH domain-containing protein n=1 Tax=Williamsia deligens TaxID=321325 RepID=A0ABW3G1V7_9NOCA|nr:PH domain-containing protein [Williamsia deligens]MCP2195061.1 PH domain-containing protein [Williamsia deligens]
MSASDPETTTTTEPVVFRISPMAYFGPVMMMVSALVLAGASLVYLGWTLVVPVLVAAWMYRIRTVATPDGIRAVGSLRTREIAWADLTGLSFPRWGSVRAVLEDSSRVRLPAVAFRDLPRLSEASGGRIPDPYAARPETRTAESQTAD